MALTPVNYQDGKTVITADNLNAIQTEVINLGNSKAPVASPNFTGTPKAPTAAETVNNTQIASTAFANRAATNAVKQVSNNNLLVNGYFVGGGSQSGAGKFPLNQRGQAIYTVASEYCIDMWKTGTSAPTVTLNENGITISKDGSDTGYIRQVLDCPFESLAGKTVTFSVMYDGGLATGTGIVPSTAPTGITTIVSLASQIPHGGGTYNRLLFFPNDNTLRVQIGQYQGELTFVAAKVELGGTQTLAHQENGTWVINEIPDWGEELRKCQKYLQWIPTPRGSGYSASVGSGICWFSTEARIAVPLACPMASTPGVTLVNANASVYLAGSTTGITPSEIFAGNSVYSNAIYRNILTLCCTIEGGVAKSLAGLVLAGTGDPSGILLSCEPTT